MMSSSIEVGQGCALSKTELCGICKDTIPDQNKQSSSSKASNGDAGDQEELSEKCSLIKLSTAPIKPAVRKVAVMISSHADEAQWYAAKMNAAAHLTRKSRESPEDYGLRKQSSSSKVASAKKQRHIQLIENCPLMNGSPLLSRRGGRKVAVCERSEVDRKLVYHSLKYFNKNLKEK